MSAAERFKIPSGHSNEGIPVSPAGPETIYGGYTQGCIVGATQFETSTESWELVNTLRNHQYGHSSLIYFVEHLGATALVKGWGKIVVGDSSCPAGMKMGRGHTSHRVGLDVDIFYKFIPIGQTLTLEERNAWDDEAQQQYEIAKYSRSVAELTHAFRPEYLEMVRAAAEYESVERIFVSPPIKAEACKTFAVESGGTKKYPAFLKKIRPWNGHRSHFHVRLKCPKSSPLCKPQGGVGVDKDDDTGVGCAGRDFTKWFKRPKPAPKPAVTEPEEPGGEPGDDDEELPFGAVDPTKVAPVPRNRPKFFNETPQPGVSPEAPKPAVHAPKTPKKLPGWLQKCEDMEASLQIINITPEVRCLVEKEPVVSAQGERVSLLRCRDYAKAETFNRFSRCAGTDTEKNPESCLLPAETRTPQSKVRAK